MKNLIFFALILSPFSFILSQQIEQTNQSETISTLKYAPEIPSPKTYLVKLNSTGDEIPTHILEQINYHRLADTDYLWKVNEHLEILIYSIYKSASENPIIE
jgi:hypothetical protein